MGGSAMILLDRLTVWQAATAIFAVACLADAANCIRLDHADWWMPATVALFCALSIRGECNE